MLEDIKLNLMINLQYEQEEGQTVRDEKGGAAMARQSRKQYSDTAELVLAIIEDEGGGRK